MMPFLKIIDVLLLLIASAYLLRIAPGYQVVIVAAIFLYLFLKAVIRLHRKYKYSEIDDMAAAGFLYRFSFYSTLLPVILFYSTTQLAFYTYGLTSSMIVALGMFAILSVLLVHEHYYTPWQLTDNMVLIISTFSKLIAFMFSTLLILYWYSFTWINLNLVFWLTFLLAFILLSQAHHKKNPHTLHSNAIMALSAWLPAIYVYFLLSLAWPAMTIAWLVLTLFAVIWNIFYHYSQQHLTRNFVLENIAVLVFISVVLWLSIPSGQVLGV